jgi:membrane-associated protease RseP (regulator of RpoE activity)
VNLALGFALLALIPMATGLPTNHGWSISKTVPDSGAATAGVLPHDQLVSFNGKPVNDFSKAFSKSVEASGGHQATLVVRRNGHLVVLHPTIGWILKSASADKLAPLASGDTITKVAGQPVSTYTAARQALHDAPSGKTTVEFLRDGTAYRTTVATPVTLPASGSQGFLGVFAEPRWARQNPVQAVGTAASSFSSMVTGSVQSIWHFFSPSGLTRWTQYVVTQNDTGTTAPKQPAAVVPVNPGAPSAQSTVATSSDSPGSNRIVSIIGMLQLGSDAGHAGFFFVLSLLALINIFLGLINLLPLPPFDGGHAAVATYEVIREKISGRPYRADMAKLLPVTYAVLALMAFVFLSSSYLDVVHPARNPFSP